MHKVSRPIVAPRMALEITSAEAESVDLIEEGGDAGVCSLLTVRVDNACSPRYTKLTIDVSFDTST